MTSPSFHFLKKIIALNSAIYGLGSSDVKKFFKFLNFISAGGTGGSDEARAAAAL